MTDDFFDSVPPHSEAKHDILKYFISAWCAVLGRWASSYSNRLLYVDGFAGTGRYKDGTEGSPLIAMRSIAAQSPPPSVPVEMIFIEKDPQFHAQLVSNIEEVWEELSRTGLGKLTHPQVIKDEWERRFSKILTQHKEEGRPLGPAFFFLDQFGYSAVPMKHVRDICKYERCDVLLNLNYNQLTHYLRDPNKHESVRAAFGDDSWRSAIDLSKDKRESCILDAYKTALQRHGNAKYVWEFSMRDRSDRLTYWLFFITGHLKGLREIKRAMWKSDPRGTFTYSDKSGPSSNDLLRDYFNDNWLEKTLHDEFRGTEVSMLQIGEFALTRTPVHKYLNAVQSLLRKGKAIETFRPRSALGSKSLDNDQIRIRFTAEIW